MFTNLKKYLGMKKMCVNSLNTNLMYLYPPFGHWREVKKVICTTACDHYDSQKNVVIVEWGIT